MKKFFIVAVILFLGTYCMGQTVPRNNVKFTPVKNKQWNTNYNRFTPIEYKNRRRDFRQFRVIELVVDYSPSMGKWIKLAKTVAISILPKIPPQTRTALRVFGQKAPGSSCEATSKLTALASNNSNNIIKGLNSAKIGYLTPLTLALEQTVYVDFKPLYRNFGKKIILITDGADTCGGNPCEFVKKLVKTRSDIVIDVIIIDGSDELKCLADETNGKYYKIKSEKEFVDAFSESLKTKPVQTPQSAPHYKFIPLNDDLMRDLF